MTGDSGRDPGPSSRDKANCALQHCSSQSGQNRSGDSPGNMLQLSPGLTPHPNSQARGGEGPKAGKRNAWRMLGSETVEIILPGEFLAPNRLRMSAPRIPALAAPSKNKMESQIWLSILFLFAAQILRNFETRTV